MKRLPRHSFWILGGNTFADMLQRRMLVVLLILILCFSALLARLWQVQVLQNEVHVHNAQRQSLRPVRLNPVRGRIFSSEGTVLVDNAAHYDLVFYISEMRQPGKLKKTIGYIVECEKKMMACIGRESALTPDDVWQQLQKRPVLPMTVARDLNEIERAKIAEFLPHIPGMEILPRAVRGYPQGGVLPHVLGMTGWRLPDGADVVEDLPRFYVTPDLVGLNGVEAVYNSELSGKAGARMLIVDSVGYARGSFEEDVTPQAGHDVVLTIDLEAQRWAEELLEGKAGAMVAVEVDTGAVIAMASSPGFDLSKMTSKEYRQLTVTDPLQRKLNRVLRGTYTPGSIMKPLLTLAALEKIPEEVSAPYECTGIYLLNKNNGIRCAHRAGHGWLNLDQAMAMSCNPYFIHLGMKLGIDDYSAFLRSAGIGEHTGMDLGESSGICPGREFAERRWHRKWLAADTAFASIGQGAVTVTPLQVAMYTAAIANGGKLMRPFVVKRIQTQTGEVLKEQEPVVRHRLPVSPANLAAVQHAMQMVVDLPAGGATAMKIAGVPMAAKTGTAEVANPPEEGGKHKNAWVTCYGPADHPTIAVTCLIERGRSGGKSAVPLAAEFARRYFDRTKATARP